MRLLCVSSGRIAAALTEFQTHGLKAQTAEELLIRPLLACLLFKPTPQTRLRPAQPPRPSPLSLPPVLLSLLLFSCLTHMQKFCFSNCCGQALDFPFVFFFLGGGVFFCLCHSADDGRPYDSLLFEGETPSSTGRC